MTVPAPLPEAVESSTTAVERELRKYPIGIMALLGGTANVIMQLSRPPVGYGVVESTVDSGKVKLHPIKRLRTTLSYLAVAWLGTDEERDAYREAVNRSHGPVKSGQNSPVRYNAFDPALQLWVAECLYWGAADALEQVCGPMDDATADVLYRESERLGTTLQVGPEMWPPDRAAFDRHWKRELETASIDDTVREYLYDLAVLGFMPLPVRLAFGRFNRVVTTGFLPQRFRDEMRLSWTKTDQLAFDALLRLIRTVNKATPAPVRMFPFNYYLWDLRRRIAHDRPLT